jgi:hypothetical protein
MKYYNIDNGLTNNYCHSRVRQAMDIERSKYKEEDDVVVDDVVVQEEVDDDEDIMDTKVIEIGDNVKILTLVQPIELVSDEEDVSDNEEFDVDIQHLGFKISNVLLSEDLSFEIVTLNFPTGK